jgi:hypothetical protein
VPRNLQLLYQLMCRKKKKQHTESLIVKRRGNWERRELEW